VRFVSETAERLAVSTAATLTSRHGRTRVSTRSLTMNGSALLILASVVACDQVLVREPKPADIAGVYQLASATREFLRSAKGYTSIPDSTIELRADGTLIVRDLPDCLVSGFGDPHGRFLSGRGTWELQKAFVGYGLNWVISPGDSLPAGGYSGPWVAIRRRSSPYDLEMSVGDPDSGETVRYERAHK